MLGRARTVLTVSKLHLITIFQRSTLEHIAASRGEQLVKGELPKAFIRAVSNSSVHATPTIQRVLMYALAVTMTHPDIVSNQTNQQKTKGYYVLQDVDWLPSALGGKNDEPFGLVRYNRTVCREETGGVGCTTIHCHHSSLS